ncbi:hypothetical protein BGZ80_002343 [Entomortierella chlamydospora]|uniref:Uncharacterized protein n=1 Tax=Entomortierella chlamydospora TaxID=101097 RepID=A0A9P6MPM9_9FUNG|nr:hypothetical protein BGZ80_002343 [Entomortierella chlamydospora]
MDKIFKQVMVRNPETQRTESQGWLEDKPFDLPGFPAKDQIKVSIKSGLLTEQVPGVEVSSSRTVQELSIQENCDDYFHDAGSSNAN